MSKTDPQVKKLIKAAGEGDLDVVSEMVEGGANVNRGYRDGFTPLICAVQQRNSEVVEFLLKNGADVNQTMVLGSLSSKTPLMFAVGDGKTLSLLIEKGANLDQQRDTDAPTCPGFTALMYANDDEASTRILVEAGADLTIVDDEGEDALMKAAASQNQAIIEILLRSGSDPSLKNKEGSSAADICRMWGRDDLAELIERFR